MDIDYKKLGFRCGLEIHQQLEGEKLFCHCPTVNTDKQGDVQAARHLRAVVGETGEIDKAAAYEMSKGKIFSYTGHSDDTCSIELDESPPLPVNKKALETGLKVALLLNAKIVDEIHFMRKTVVDGSNVSGFQRTALIAMDGYIETEKTKVSIPIICLEEEASQKLQNEKEVVHYKLDRLGIPLIEIATSASILDNEQAKQVASHIGMVLRSVEGMKRGIGSIRQDVNISIERGARTEVKGFQDLKSIPKVIAFEVQRQQDAISHGKKLLPEVRKAEPDFTTSFLRPMPGAARMYPETDVLPVEISKEYKQHLKKNLPQLLRDRVQEFERKYNVSADVASELMVNNRFSEYVTLYSAIPTKTIAHILITMPKEVKKRFNLDVSKVSHTTFEEVLGYLNEGKITKEAVIDVFVKRVKGEKVRVEEFKSITNEELELTIKKIVQEKPGLHIGGYMGLVMAKYRGKVEGKKVMELLKKEVK